MIIKNVLVDWLFVFERGKKGKYGCAVLLDKGSPQAAAVIAERDKQIGVGIEKNKFTEAQTKSKSFKECIRDGDEEIESEGRAGHYRNKLFFNCNNKEQPGILGPDFEPLLDKKHLYSGCICHVDVNFYPFNNESNGIGAGLNNIMLVEEGERLDGRQSAEEAFAGLRADNDLQ